MNIKNGRIKNMNKKLIATALAFTLVTVPLTGCEGYETFEYTTNEQGEYVASGKIAELDELQKLATIPSREGLLTMFASGLLAIPRDFAICLDLHSKNLEN